MYMYGMLGLDRPNPMAIRHLLIYLYIYLSIFVYTNMNVVNHFGVSLETSGSAFLALIAIFETETGRLTATARISMRCWGY
jgi:hypothetical protein